MPSLDRTHRAPSQALPAHAADCHMHVLGPFDRYPLAAERAYNVPEALLEPHEAMKRQVGLEPTVLVQASGCGYDNRALLDALARLEPRGRAVAVIPLSTPTAELAALHRAGVRGLRLNLGTLASFHSGDCAQLVREHERVLAPLGWHLQIFEPVRLQPANHRAAHHALPPIKGPAGGGQIAAAKTVQQHRAAQLLDQLAGGPPLDHSRYLRLALLD